MSRIATPDELLRTWFASPGGDVIQNYWDVMLSKRAWLRTHSLRPVWITLAGYGGAIQQPLQDRFNLPSDAHRHGLVLYVDANLSGVNDGAQFLLYGPSCSTEEYRQLDVLPFIQSGAAALVPKPYWKYRPVSVVPSMEDWARILSSDELDIDITERSSAPPNGWWLTPPEGYEQKPIPFEDDEMLVMPLMGSPAGTARARKQCQHVLEYTLREHAWQTSAVCMAHTREWASQFVWTVILQERTRISQATGTQSPSVRHPPYGSMRDIAKWARDQNLRPLAIRVPGCSDRRVKEARDAGFDVEDAATTP